MRASRALGVLFVFVCLATQNLLIFAKHWVGHLTFPFDFSLTYHAFPFYWQGAIRAGIAPAWEPFQGTGMPFGAMMQTGLYYPPLWIYPAVGAIYSLQAATQFACAHVLLGALGAAFLARVRCFTLGWVLLAGIAYQFFGGFFSNAGHPDIARGFAYLPWLVAALTPDAAEERLPPRVWLTPLWVLCFVTGSYPGQWIAGLLLLGLYVGFGMLDGGRPRAAFARWGLLALGVGLAAVYLVPAFAVRTELARFVDAGSFAKQSLSLDHFLAAPFQYEGTLLDLDPSIRALFVPLPVLGGLVFLRGPDIRTHRALLLVALLATALVLGGPTFRFFVRLVPPLGLSRFPAADYRGWIALGATIVGTAGLRSAFERRLPLWRVGLGSLGLAAILWRAQRDLPWPPEVVGAVAAALAALVLVALAAAAGLLDRRLASSLAIVIAFWDGWRFHQAQPNPWQISMPYQDHEEMDRELIQALENPPAARPARDASSQALDGYRRGRWVLWDYAGSDHLRVYRAIVERRGMASYVFGPSDPQLEPRGTARSVLYAPDDVRYLVSAPVDGVLVENEPWSRGWSAAKCETGTRLARDSERWPLRGWHVPAGTYEVCVRYSTPGLRVGALASLGSAVVWAILALRRRRKAVSRTSPARES